MTSTVTSLEVCVCVCVDDVTVQEVSLDEFTGYSPRSLLFVANVNSRSRLLYVVVRLSSVVCNVHPTQAIEIFGNISTLFGTLAIC